MKPFTEAFCQIYPLSPEAVSLLDSMVKTVTHPRKTVLFQPGEEAPYVLYLRQGLLRIFSDHHARQTTTSFREEGQFYGNPSAVLTGRPSDKGVELLERSVLEYLDVREYARCREGNLELEKAWGQLLAYALLQNQRRFEGMQFMNAHQRYEVLRSSSPSLLNRVPLKYIASYLGVTPVSVSRIRAALR